MVNGKSSVVSGEASWADALQPKAGNKAANQNAAAQVSDFASFLPGGQKTAAAMQIPAQNAPLPRPESLSSSIFGASREGSGTTSPKGAASKPSGAVNGAPQASLDLARQTTAGRALRSRTSARAESQTAVLQKDAGKLMQQGTGRVSSRPITGRGNLGMQDTRASRTRSAGGSTLTTRGAMTQSPAQAQNPYRTPRAADVHGQRLLPGIGGLTEFSNPFTPGGMDAPIEFRVSPALAKALEQSSSPLKTLNTLQAGITFGAVQQVQFPDKQEAGPMSVLTSSHKRKDGALGPRYFADSPSKGLAEALSEMESGLGKLAAKFESGPDGIAAIGYDRHGGTSYGKYQLSSRAGTMSGFIDYLRKEAPDMADRLAKAGPANTGGRSGAMPSVWRSLAAENPQRFEQLQNDFIRRSHFEPAMQAIAQNTGLSFDKMPHAFKEVVFSTAVQHGPSGASRIISRAVTKVGAERLQAVRPESFKEAGENLIRQIYAIRAGQFVSSTEKIQLAAKNRLKTEMREVLNMLS